MCLKTALKVGTVAVALAGGSTSVTMQSAAFGDVNVRFGADVAAVTQGFR